MNFKAAAIAVFILIYLYNLMLTVIHMRSAGNPVPANVSDVYDPETYRKWRSYHAEKSRFSILTSTVSFIIDLLLLALNVYAAFVSLFPGTPFMQIFAVMLLRVIMASRYSAVMPFSTS